MTSAVVQRALIDAEKLMTATGQPVAVTERTQLCTAICYKFARTPKSVLKVSSPHEPSLAQLFKALRALHADDIAKMLGAMATMVDVLNPLRNKASGGTPQPTTIGGAGSAAGYQLSPNTFELSRFKTPCEEGQHWNAQRP